MSKKGGCWKKVAKIGRFITFVTKQTLFCLADQAPENMPTELPGLSTNEDAHAKRVVQLDEGFLADYKIPACPFSVNVHVVAEHTTL